MKIRFVSHASFIVESNGVSLICDPWLVGKAFNQGWALVSPADSVAWKNISYIWISHQHPDHLNFPTLKSIDRLERQKIEVLYQKHASERIPKVLRGLGYPKVQELSLHRWFSLAAELEVICGSCGSMDSWIAIRAERITVLNLNDCVMSAAHLRKISQLVGKVDVLFTQFSFANWIGNHCDERGEAARKIDDLLFRVRFLEPEATVPFASYIYFCNQENCWMNKFAVTPLTLTKLNIPGLNFMYPGDTWDSSKKEFKSDSAVDRYMKDISSAKTIDPTPRSVPASTIEYTATKTLRGIRRKFGRFLLSKASPFEIYMPDVNKLLIINTRAATCRVREATNEGIGAARFVMCSQVAWYAFAYSWGWGAMEVSGMYSDRQWREPNLLAVYLNILSTEVLPLGSPRQVGRALEFFWAKRCEIIYRLKLQVADLFVKEGLL